MPRINASYYLEKQLLVRKFVPSDVEQYMILCQVLFEATYPSKELEIPKHLFSKEHFFTQEMLQYFKRVMVHKKNNIGLVVEINKKIIAGIAVREYKRKYELRCLYVAQELQNKGIGTLLWNEVLKRIDISKPIELGVISHNKRSIAIYKKWGFRLCPKKDWGIIHWSTWDKKYVIPLAKMRIIPHEKEY